MSSLDVKISTPTANPCQTVTCGIKLDERNSSCDVYSSKLEGEDSVLHDGQKITENAQVFLHPGSHKSLGHTSVRPRKERKFPNIPKCYDEI